MARKRIQSSLAVAICLFSQVSAQDEAETCYGAGSVVGAVIGTLIVTLGLLSIGFFLYKMYWKNRKGKHLVLMTDAENPNDQYAFDNPCFREATPIKRNIQDEKQESKLEKNKWLNWTPLHPFGKEHKEDKITSMDDSYINDSRLKVVTLKSHDFTGLGFNICGNMRDGIFVKDVLHRGPAFESGCINPGDRIDSVCISFRNMVFEDALAILSYASPYDVQVQVENDSYSRPSTLIRSKRDSSAVTSAKISHPKFCRSQSVSHLNEIEKGSNKKLAHQIAFTLEKNRINQALNKSSEHHGSPNEYPTLKVSAASNHPKKEHQKLEKNAAPKMSPLADNKKLEENSHPGDSQNKLQKFGIKVLPITMNPKMGIQSVTGAKKLKDPITTTPTAENEVQLVKEKPEKPIKPKPTDIKPHGLSESAESSGNDETDASKENMKGMLAKGLQNLKEKINQNTLGKKKNKDSTSDEDTKLKDDVTVTVSNGDSAKNSEQTLNADCPVPKLRSTVACGVKAYEKNQQNHLQTSVPEEVSRAGDVARNNRKSISDPSMTRKSVISLDTESEEIMPEQKNKKKENYSDSDSLSDLDSSRVSDEAKKPKKSKGKAPAPPNPSKNKTSPKSSILTPKEINEIKSESELEKDEKMSIFEPIQDSETILLRDHSNERGSHINSYDSDSDIELATADSQDSPNSTKIELNATQVTIHQDPSGDNNDDDIEPSRKAASLGDLSKLDSEQPLSIVLERAVSLDLTEGTSQCGKKRKAPLPPSEEFPTVFNDLNYRKEPRLENQLGLNTFQRRLKKSSDFGTLEDALCDGPKSLEIEMEKHSPSLNLTETHSYNIQEFSSWLAECRKPKANNEENVEVVKPTKISSTSLVNINPPNRVSSDVENEEKPQYEYQGSNVSFSVNGQNFPDFDISDTTVVEPQSVNFPGMNSKTVVVISQPNSLEPTILETVPVTYTNNNDMSPSKDSTADKESNQDQTSLTSEISLNEILTKNVPSTPDESMTPPKLPTSPMPVMSSSGALSSPLSSSLTYITEIKVSTSEKNGDETPTKSQWNSSSDDSMTDFSFTKSETPKSDRSESVREKIEKFDSKPLSVKDFDSSKSPTYSDNNDYIRKENQLVFDSSKIPIRTMKSETGQKVLATIQSLAAKESSPTKTPEVEYAKRVASLFSGNNSMQNNQMNITNKSINMESEITGPNFSGLNFKTGRSPPKPSTDYSPTRKVPPVVPPRKMETSLSSKSTVTVELPGKNHDRNLVTFSSFIPNTKNEEPGSPSRISFKIKEHGEINGKDNAVPIKTSGTKIIFESKENANDF